MPSTLPSPEWFRPCNESTAAGISMDMTGTTEDLVTAAMAGDREAFASLVRLESRDAYRLTLVILRNPHDAEDAAQDAFLRAWRQLPGLRAAGAWTPWFRRVTVNSALALHRRRGNGRATVPLGELEPAPLPDGSGYVAMRDQVKRLVGGLEEADRALLVLRFGLDLELADVAAALGIPLGTAKSRLHRALTRLRAQLEATDGR
jgi:RNA polymerase sigma-70 factor (ECF subfamily)